MKKYLPLALLAVSSFFVIGCTTDNSNNNPAPTTDSDTISYVMQLNNQSFQHVGQSYLIHQGITGMQKYDMALVYVNTATSGAYVWQLLPYSDYVTANPSDNRQFQYSFDFTQTDVQIYASANYDLSTTPGIISGKTFRILLIPASGQGGKVAPGADTVNFKDYNSVVKYYHIDDSNPKVLK
jgi:hypothetical protein